MTAVRPGDQATAVILAMQDELTALGLLPPGDGAGPRPRLGRAVTRIGDGEHGNCGTDAGYRVHLRAGDDACPRCLAAHAAANRKHQAARPQRPACPSCKAPKPDHLTTCASIADATRSAA